jgi:hypothetical protein
LLFNSVLISFSSSKEVIFTLTWMLFCWWCTDHRKHGLISSTSLSDLLIDS